MAKNKFIAVPEVGHVLISGPLYDWLMEQNSNVVSLPWAPPQGPSSSIITRPFHYLRWKMVLFFDENKRAKQGWRLEPEGKLPETEVMQFIEENFS